MIKKKRRERKGKRKVGETRSKERNCGRRGG